jgi:hypothetical protein
MTVSIEKAAQQDIYSGLERYELSSTQVQQFLEKKFNEVSSMKMDGAENESKQEFGKILKEAQKDPEFQTVYNNLI